ncbi:hypothetical protein MRB53_037648 [Persea americana]|nr:hypothetical protein MRB53_037648 [Persea americana]
MEASSAAPDHDAHMLYTVSAVQILATLDAFDDFEAKYPGGKLEVSNCGYHLRERNNCSPTQSWRTCKIGRRALSEATSGEKWTRAFSTEHSML